MKRIWIILSIIIVTWVFIYSLTILSSLNTCSWVRSFDCEKAISKSEVTWTGYNELRKTWNLFLKYCNPIIRDETTVYSLDYSKCDLNINISRTSPWVDSVFVNWTSLSRDEINSNF